MCPAFHLLNPTAIILWHFFSSVRSRHSHCTDCGRFEIPQPPPKRNSRQLPFSRTRETEERYETKQHGTNERKRTKNKTRQNETERTKRDETRRHGTKQKKRNE